MDVIDLNQKFAMFSDTWSPRIIADLNGQQVKLAKLSGSFVRHAHENEDELFFVVKGRLYLDFDDGTKEIGEGQMIVVPRGVQHLPYTSDGEEAWVMLFEPSATLHTGNVVTDRTVINPERI